MSGRPCLRMFEKIFVKDTLGAMKWRTEDRSGWINWSPRIHRMAEY